MKLYYSPGACSLAAHIVFREICVPIELVEIVVARRENFSPEFLKVNPRARVPTLEIDGEIYTEVPALLTFAASLRPDAGLLPPLGSAQLARCLEWLGWFSSSLHIAYAQLWRPERFLPPTSDSREFIESARPIVERMNREVEDRILGPWLLGDRYSIADAYALPFYRWGNRIGIPMAECCPRWAAWAERMLQRPAVREAIDTEKLGYESFDVKNSD